MKKITALLCVLCALFLATGALAAPGDAYLFNTDQKKELGITDYSTPSMALLGDTLYTLMGAELYTWKIGDALPAKVASGIPFGYYSTYEDAQTSLGDKAEQQIQWLVANGDTLYGLNTLNGKLFPLTLADGEMAYGEPIQLDWSLIEDQQSSDSYLEISTPHIAGDRLYLLARGDDTYYNPAMYSFSLSSGECKTCNVSNVQDIAAYKDGKLLLEVYDVMNAYQSDTGEQAKPTLAAYNPVDDSITELGNFGDVNVYGIVYGEESDTLYYTTNSKLMAMPALGEAVQVAYMPIDYASNAVAFLLPGGLYAIDTWDGLIIRNTDPQYMPTSSLSIYGSSMDNAATSFMAANPDTPVTFNQDEYYRSASALAQAMTSGDAAFDIYSIDLSYQDFQSLMDKGYCLNLTPYTGLTDELSSLYPFIQQAITKDGAFYGVPTYLYGYGLSTVTEAWENAGLTDRIPSSFMGLIDFVQWWLDEGLDDHPDMQLVQGTQDYHDTFFQLAFELYVNQYQAEKKDLTLDTPEFREMLEAVETLDYDALNDTLPAQDDSDEYMNYVGDEQSDYLFTNYGSWLSVYANDDSTEPLVLSIEDGGARYIPAYISCMFVNPNTEHPDLAAAYLLNVLNNMDKTQHVTLFPDDNDPIPNEYYETMIADTEKMLAEAQANLETAAPEDVKDIQSAIDSYTDFLNRKDDYYWTASAESIAKYRTYASLCFASTPNVLNYSTSDEGSSEISSLLQRYGQKQITLDQFITQTDQKIRMIQAEMQ